MERDINDVLEKIIEKYEIDRFHPRFSKKRKAVQCLKEYFSDYEDESLILIASCDTDSDYVEEDFSLKRARVFQFDELDPNSFHDIKNSGNVVVIVSYYKRREIKSLLSVYGINAVSIYDYLFTRGIQLEGNYYDIFSEEYDRCFSEAKTINYKEIDMNGIFFYDRRCYEIAQDEAVAEMYLARMIFDCIYVKDFMLTRQYIEEYIAKKFTYAERYCQCLSEIEGLLEKIKTALAERNKDDVIIFWLDQLEYGEDKDMPFLCSLSENSIDFENAYTVTPYTHSTAKVLMTGRYTVDDKGYQQIVDRNCSFIKQIENRGYSFKFYTFLREVDRTVKGRSVYNRQTPLSEMCWDVLCDMVYNSVPICSIIHEVDHTHSPYISFGLTQARYAYSENPGRILDADEMKIRQTQKIESCVYTDKVLKLYNEIIPLQTLKIFMSDHGHTETGQWHTIFRIVQEDIQPLKIKKIFSYINFEKLVLMLVDKNKDMDFDLILTEYAYIQDIDTYSKQYLKAVLLNNIKSLSNVVVFGYKGIITETDQYIRYNDGSVQYMNTNASGKKLTRERERYLGSLVSAYPKDLIEDNKFKYSKYVYQTFANYYKRNGTYENKKRCLVKKLFDDFSEKDVVAVRGGGTHTLGMWFALDWKQREKIHYIIDKDKECAASHLGVEIISPELLSQKKIDQIVISSFDYEKDWYEELKNTAEGIKIIGLYKYLGDCGIWCDRSYYHEEITYEDVAWEGKN